MSGAVKPGVPRSTRKPRISPSSVRAQTTATSEIEPFVIHIFAPFRIQSEPSRFACVRIVPGSEPASGSVSPKQPIASPRCIGRQPALLLLLGAPAPDRVHRERALHGDGAADAGVARLELEADEAVRDGARPGQAVALEVHPEEPELRELLHDLAREDPLLEPVADLRAARARGRTGARCRGSPAPRRRGARRARGSRAGRVRAGRRSSSPRGSSRGFSGL